MSRKKYFVVYYQNFSNTYNLYWTDCKEMEERLPAEAKRISRKEAEGLCADENRRRKHDRGSAFFADSAIYPSDFDGCNYDIETSKRHRKNGYIWEKK